MPSTQKSFSAYREEVAARLAALRIREPTGAEEVVPGARADERLAQCIWFDRLFVHDVLKTVSGKDLEIVQAGRWNQDEGPDFRDAKVRLGGRTLRGDVEVHLLPEGWRQHRHHLNSEYNGVVLHACLWRGPGKPTPARTAAGRPIETFVMEPVLFPDLDTIRQTVHVEDYPYQTLTAAGRCQPLMCSLDDEYVGGFLDAAGRERLEAKALRFRSQAEGETLEQVLYQAIMTAMGHKASKGLFFLLSKRAPLCELTDYLRDYLAPRGRAAADQGEAERQPVRFLQAILLRVASLAPGDATDLETPEQETGDYLAELNVIWRDFAGYFSDRVIPPTKRWIAGARPVNFAHRRIGGVAHLLARWFLDGGVAKTFAPKFAEFDSKWSPQVCRRWIRRELVEAFVVDRENDFWAWRYNFGSKRAPRAMKLIGESRAASIVFNALLPLLLLLAWRENDEALERKVIDVFSVFPPLESNAIVRHMRARLFGDDPRAKALLRTEARQQALFQIFAECCSENDSGCEDCAYLRMHG